MICTQLLKRQSHAGLSLKWLKMVFILLSGFRGVFGLLRAGRDPPILKEDGCFTWLRMVVYRRRASSSTKMPRFHACIREEVYLLQGRVGKSIFMHHYFSPNIMELKDKVLKATACMRGYLSGGIRLRRGVDNIISDPIRRPVRLCS